MRAGIRPEFVKNESEVRRKLRRQHDPGTRTRNAPVPASAGLCFDQRAELDTFPVRICQQIMRHGQGADTTNKVAREFGGADCAPQGLRGYRLRNGQIVFHAVIKLGDEVSLTLL